MNLCSKYNFKESDSDLLSSELKDVIIYDYISWEWHDFVLFVRHENGSPFLALKFVYEKSLCSCDRETVFDKMRKKAG